MAMKTRYTVIEGEVMSELRSGTKLDYLPDPLGSTVALLDTTATKTDMFEYWPYGEIVSRTGTTTTPFQFIGSYGYFNDISGRIYVRSRYLNSSCGRWDSADPFFMDEKEYIYVWNRVCTFIDINGAYPQKPGQGKAYIPVPGERVRKGGDKLSENCFQWACGGLKATPNGCIIPENMTNKDEFCNLIIEQARKQGVIWPLNAKKECDPGSHKVRFYVSLSCDGFKRDLHVIRRDFDGSWSDKHGPYGGIHEGMRDPDAHANNCQVIETSRGKFKYQRCGGEYCASNKVMGWGPH